MKASVDQDILFPLLDTLLERWRAKKFPYDKKDAIIPQHIIPEDLRKDKKALAIFYLLICIYMRGGIKSLQVFKALLRMRNDYPHLFDPFYVHGHLLLPKDIQPILKKYVGWDSEAASINWVTNCRHLVDHWGGNPLNLLENLADYPDPYAEFGRRVRYKQTKKELGNDGPKYRGFRGFQWKMVSMLIYFYDWEGWLKPRFLFPAPADFHNFRLGLSQGAIKVELRKGEKLRGEEALSRPWRDAVMDYLKARKADPVEVADAIWMYSLVMCGNSPLTTTMRVETNGSGMFKEENLGHDVDRLFYHNERFRKALLDTCLRCPIAKGCTLAIPAKLYYTKGRLHLRKRVRVEEHFGSLNPDTPSRLPKKKPSVDSLPLFDPDD